MSRNPPRPKKHNKVNEHCRSSELLICLCVHCHLGLVLVFICVSRSWGGSAICTINKDMSGCWSCLSWMRSNYFPVIAQWTLDSISLPFSRFSLYQNLSNSFDALYIRSELTEYFLLCNSLSLIMLQPNVTFSTAWQKRKVKVLREGAGHVQWSVQVKKQKIHVFLLHLNEFQTHLASLEKHRAVLYLDTLSAASNQHLCTQ